MWNETITNPLRYFIYIPLAVYLGIKLSGFISPILWSAFREYTANEDVSMFTTILYYSYQTSKYLLAGLTFALVVSVVVPKTHKAGFYAAIFAWAVVTYYTYSGIDALSSGIMAVQSQRVGLLISFLVTVAVLIVTMKYTVNYLEKGDTDKKLEQKEYESMSGLVEEFGEEQEQEDIDTVFDNLQDNQEKSL